MRAHPFHLLSLLSLAGAFAGCAAAHEPPGRPRGAVDEEGVIEPVTYLVRGFSLPGERSTTDPYPSSVPGFDLDGLRTDWDSETGSCEDHSVDFTSSLDPEEAGVDNLLAVLLPTLDLWLEERGSAGLGAEVQRAISEGRLLLAIEVAGLHAAEDGEVTLRVFAAEPADGTLDLLSDLAPDGSERARPAAQALRGTLIAEAVGRSRGSLVEAWFSVLPLEVEGEAIPLLPLEDLRSDRAAIALRFDAEGEASGALGGSVSVDAVEANAVAAGFPESDVRYVTDSLREYLSDMTPSREDPTVCERFSLGLGLDLVRVGTLLR